MLKISLIDQYFNLMEQYDKLKSIDINYANLVAVDIQTIANRLGW